MTDQPQPTHPALEPSAPHLVLAPAWVDPTTQALYVHRDLVEVRRDWAVKEYVGPPRVDQTFGDTGSWASYVLLYGSPDQTLATWNAHGLHAVLDYHDLDRKPGRCAWIARRPFVVGPEWAAWSAFANGAAISQRQAVERLEDLADDIVEPAAADLMSLLRVLRANVKASAETALRPDGSTSISWSQDKQLTKAGNATELPGSLKLALPVLKGQSERWEVGCRLRVSVDDQAHLTLRLALVNPDRVLERVYAEEVAVAAKLLDSYALLRAGD